MKEDRAPNVGASLSTPSMTILDIANWGNPTRSKDGLAAVVFVHGINSQLKPKILGRSLKVVHPSPRRRKKKKVKTH